MRPFLEGHKYYGDSLQPESTTSAHKTISSKKYGASESYTRPVDHGNFVRIILSVLSIQFVKLPHYK